MRRFEVKRGLLIGTIVIGLLAVSLAGQLAIRRMRNADTPIVADGLFAAMGGLRSIVAEVIWFRADRLQDEGRYVELAQLAGMLTAMEPHTPEVWSYASWNLAYNISIMMATPEDRWRWVHAGLRLLRDEGLKYNPGDPELCRDVAWMFELKLGANIDSASDTYRAKWREIVEDVKARDAWRELKMEPEKMRAIERESGMTDWTDPCLSAVYWAAEGLPKANKRERAFLMDILRQSTAIYRKRH